MATNAATLTRRVRVGPQPGPQTDFLACPADIVFYGGAAGGGKTYGLLLECLRYIRSIKGFRPVIFRRESTQVTNTGGLWDTSADLYPLVGGVPRQHILTWSFPPHGNTIRFAHMQRDRDYLKYQGAQVPLLCFDELTHFTRRQFMYMISRSRTTAAVTPYIRATYNPVPPDDKVGGWIHDFVGWYLTDDGYPDPERVGRVRWFINLKDSLTWYDDQATAAAAAVDMGLPPDTPRTFAYIAASVYDNKILLAADPAYLANLMALSYIDSERLLRANHKIKAAAGKVFNRGWFKVVDAAPAAFDALVRFWDLAATERKVARGAATASVLMGLRDYRFYILDITEDWTGPAETDALIVRTASRDGTGVAIRWEREGGSAGKRDARYLTGLLAGYDAGGVIPQGDKLQRSRALAAQVKAGNVDTLRADWTDRLLSHMHAVPDGGRMDLHDAAAGAFNYLLSRPTIAVVSDDRPVTISPY